MGSFRHHLAVLCILGVLLGAAVPAQEQPPPSPAPGDVPPHYAEVMRVQAVVMQLLARAFAEDPTLAERLTAFEAVQEKAMVAQDPETARRLARMTELQSLHNQTVARNAVPEVDALLEEGRALTQALRATAAAVRRQPGVAAEAEALAAAIRVRFGDPASLDPAAAQFISQPDALIELLMVARLVGR